MSGNRLKSAFFEGGGSLNEDFRVKGASPTNHCWSQSSRVIALSCGIQISAVRHIVLSQCTRVTDGQMDGRTDGQTDRITTPKTALAYARAVKKLKRSLSLFNIRNNACVCSPAFSPPAFLPVPRCPVPRFQSPQIVWRWASVKKNYWIRV